MNEVLETLAVNFSTKVGQLEIDKALLQVEVKNLNDELNNLREELSNIKNTMEE